MTIKILLLLFLAYSFTLGTKTYADNMTDIKTQKLLRFIDTQEEYGKFCEAYSYISSVERLKLIKQNFLLGDILGDSLSIPSINAEQLISTSLSECNTQNNDVGKFTYREKIDYFNENIVAIEVSQYEYGAGAAHGNQHISYYIYDREYGMKLDWETLFGKNETFDKYVFERVLKEIADEGFITYFKANNQLFNFRNAGYFTITSEGLLIQYGKYEITPGSVGLPSIVVPKEVLKQHMDAEMYKKCFCSERPILAKAIIK